MVMRDKILLLVVVASTIFGGLSGFCFGVNYGFANSEPQMRVVEKPIEVIKLVEQPPIIVEAEKIITNERLVYINVPIKIYPELKNFSTEKELKDWLSAKGLPQIRINFGNYDCEDIARELVNKALKDGYYMSLQFVEHPYRCPLDGSLLTTSGIGHVLCGVIIGNNVLYIEPSTYKYWLVGYLD